MYQVPRCRLKCKCTRLTAVKGAGSHEEMSATPAAADAHSCQEDSDIAATHSKPSGANRWMVHEASQEEALETSDSKLCCSLIGSPGSELRGILVAHSSSRGLEAKPVSERLPRPYKSSQRSGRVPSQGAKSKRSTLFIENQENVDVNPVVYP